LDPWVYKAQKESWTAGYTKKFVSDRQAMAKKSLGGFEQALSEGKYFVGNSITIADIVWFCTVWGGFKTVFTAEYLKEFPRLSEHFRKLEALPEFKAHAGGPLPTPAAIELEFAAEAPARFHRLVTITDGKTTMKLKLFKESTGEDIQLAIKNRFKLPEAQRFVLIDEEGCDVVVDGTLETATYKLELS